MKRYLLLAACVLAMTACDVAPVRKVESTNPKITDIGVLFEVDGYRMYRFTDGEMSHFIYFVVPIRPLTAERSAATSWEENCGKGCTRIVQVQTTP
jgi:hypothetical protein